jgi:hypothetical protein
VLSAESKVLRQDGSKDSPPGRQDRKEIPGIDLGDPGILAVQSGFLANPLKLTSLR